MSQPQGLKSV